MIFDVGLGATLSCQVLIGQFGSVTCFGQQEAFFQLGISIGDHKGNAKHDAYVGWS